METPTRSGPLAMLGAWLAGRGMVRPAVLRPTIGPESRDHAQGALVDPYNGRVRNEPSAGLHHVNRLVAGADRPTPGLTADLNPTDLSAWGRPGRHHVAFSTSTATGDAAADRVDNNGTHTRIASRPSAPTMPRGGLPAGEPWRADFRTAPGGQLGIVTRPEYGSAAAGGDRTRWRIVPPTDAANPPPAPS